MTLLTHVCCRTRTEPGGDNDGGGGNDESDLARFDLNDNGQIDRQELLNAISAYNSDETVGGEPVDKRDVQKVIQAYNNDEAV